MNSEIYKFFRTLNRIIPKKEIILDRFGNRDVFISVTSDSFIIFDLDKFDILFLGPNIPNLGTYFYSGNILYISSGNKVLKYQRSTLVGSTEYEKEIVQILVVGDLVCVVDCESRLFIAEDGLVHFGDVNLVHHPHTYLNKLVLVQDSSSVLFNFEKKKIIYKFTSLKEGITTIADSKVVDVVGVGYDNGQVDLVDLKKDKVLFTLNVKGRVLEMDFSTDKLSVVTESNLYIFDLVEKRLILKKGDVISCRFVDEKYLLLVSKDISLVELNKDRLEVVKVKHTCTGDILGIDYSDENNFLVFTKSEIYKYNTGNTLTYTKYKFSGTVEKYTVDSRGLGFIYGNRILYRLGSSIKEVLSTEVALLASHKNICVILAGDKLVFMNSRNVYLTITVDLPVQAIQMDREKLYVLCEKKFIVIPYKQNKVKSLRDVDGVEVEGFKDFELFDSFVLFKSPDKLSLFVDGRVFRSFSCGEYFCCGVSGDLKWLAVGTQDGILVYDILSGNLLDTIPVVSKSIKFSKDMLFLIVVTASNEIVLLNNKLMFCPRGLVQERIVQKKVEKEGFVQAQKKHQKLYNEILLNKEILQNNATPQDLFQDDQWVYLLTREDLPRILNLLIDQEEHWLINKVLRLRHKDLSEMESILEKYLEKFSKYEENYLKAVGYLELEREKMI